MNYEAVCRFLSKPIEMEINAYSLDPVAREIKIDTIQGPIFQTLRDIVKQCYDINVDDRLLRYMISLREEERGNYFSKLRTEYRIRREFFNYTIYLNGEENSLFNMLQLLGFKVKKAA
jgi:erythronate-4-phosphate dehydrogenase